MTKYLQATWYQPEHRLWSDFVSAVGSMTLSENDWNSYLVAHDLDELPEVAAEVERVRKLLEPETLPLPPKPKRVRKKKS